MQIELKAETGGFSVPFALPCRVQDSGDEILQSLKALPPDVLSALCDEFRAGVFAHAGVPDPREVKPAAGASRTQELLTMLDYYASRRLEATEGEYVRVSAAYQRSLTALQEALS